jgi:hypothetical protein
MCTNLSETCGIEITTFTIAAFGFSALLRGDAFLWFGRYFPRAHCRLRAWGELTGLGVPDLTEFDRAFDALARASIDGLIGMLDRVASLEDGHPL